MPAPARGREEQEGLSQEAALAGLSPVELSIDPTFAQPALPIAGGLLQFPEVTGAGVWVRAELERIEGMASKAGE